MTRSAAVSSNDAGAAPRGLERALLAGALVGAMPGLLLAFGSQLAPVQRPLSFALALATWGLAAGLVGALALWLPGLLVGRLLGRPWLGAAFAPAMALVVALKLTSEWLALAPRATSSGAGLRVAFFAALVALAAQVWPRARWRHGVWIARGLALLACAALAAATWPRQAAAPSAARAAAPSAALPAAPLLVFGIDGGDWDFIDPLLARGELPALAALRARGVWGELATQRPTLSPVVWTTIATGRSPRVHGVHGFVTETLRGVDGPLPELRPAEGGVSGAFLGLLRRAGVVDAGPIRSDARQVPALWNVATRAGSPLNVVDWWATWPAERVLGAIVSERVYYRPEAALGGGRLTWPRELAERLRSLVLRREQVGYEQARRFMELTPEEFAALGARPARERTLEAQLTYFCAMTETDRRVALHLTEEGRRRTGRAPDLLVLFRLVDMVSHTSAQYSELVEDHLGATPDELRRYGRVVSEAYRTVDRALGDLVAAFGAQANVVVVSDHGFELQSHPPEWQPSYDHRNGAAGMFLAAGPAFRSGRVDGLGVLDVFPLLAELKGLPLSAELEGREARAALGALFVPAHATRRVPSYGPRDDAGSAGVATGADAELMERLRALGYVQ